MIGLPLSALLLSGSSGAAQTGPPVVEPSLHLAPLVLLAAQLDFSDSAADMCASSASRGLEQTRAQPLAGLHGQAEPLPICRLWSARMSSPTSSKPAGPPFSTLTPQTDPHIARTRQAKRRRLATPQNASAPTSCLKRGPTTVELRLGAADQEGCWHINALQPAPGLRPSAGESMLPPLRCGTGIHLATYFLELLMQGRSLCAGLDLEAPDELTALPSGTSSGEADGRGGHGHGSGFKGRAVVVLHLIEAILEIAMLHPEASALYDYLLSQ